MISFVRGKVADLTGDALVIDLGGIGLEVFAPFARLQPAPAIGEEILLYTHLQIREDNWQLYGFKMCIRDRYWTYRYCYGPDLGASWRYF